jgi:hypothetical protein
MTRAQALTADPAGGVDNATFWSQQCYPAVRCLLHTAALDHGAPVAPGDGRRFPHGDGVGPAHATTGYHVATTNKKPSRRSTQGSAITGGSCVARDRIELSTFRFSGGRSYQLSYLAGRGSAANRGEVYLLAAS